jgi:hypothetical protein
MQSQGLYCFEADITKCDILVREQVLDSGHNLYVSCEKLWRVVSPQNVVDVVEAVASWT